MTQPGTYYDGIAAGYNELHGDEQRAKYALLAHALALEPGASVLDVGAGTGIGNEYFPQAVGIDPSAGLIAQHPHPQSTQGRAESLPYTDNSFDAVLCVSAIHHADAAAALREMVRVARQWVAVSVLKRSPQATTLRQTIEQTLRPERFIEEDKDWLFIASVEKIKNVLGQ